MYNFRNLDVWESSMKLVTEIWKVTATFPDFERYGIISQINRSAISIPSNIAGGSSKSSNTYFINFLKPLLDSAFELETQLLISRKMYFLPDAGLKRLKNLIHGIQKQLSGLIQYLRNSSQSLFYNL